MADETQPLVSCIMPTADRRVFIPQAIHYFLRQDYHPKELIIVDDGNDPVSDLMPVDERIRSIRLGSKATVGAKRNLACGQAQGRIIIHWDDDDWMADWRIRSQVEQLRSEQADICGLNRVLFFDPMAESAWEYIFPGTRKPWVYGATLAYTTSFWQRNPFPDVDVGEDTRFVWNDPEARIVLLADNRCMAALIHPGNTSRKEPDGHAWRPLPLTEIKQLLGPDWDWYAAGNSGKISPADAMAREARQ